MKLKIFAICLVCLILGMGILDAPEYVRCTHLGLCEFLEFQGHLLNILQLKKMTHIMSTTRNHFFSVLEDILSRKKLIQKIFSFCIPNLLMSLKTSSPDHNARDFLIKEIGNKYPLLDIFTAMQTLALIQTTVMLS